MQITTDRRVLEALVAGLAEDFDMTSVEGFFGGPVKIVETQEDLAEIMVGDMSDGVDKPIGESKQPYADFVSEFPEGIFIDHYYVPIRFKGQLPKSLFEFPENKSETIV